MEFKKIGNLYYIIVDNELMLLTIDQMKYFIWWWSVKQKFNLKTKDDR